MKMACLPDEATAAGVWTISLTFNGRTRPARPSSAAQSVTVCARFRRRMAAANVKAPWNPSSAARRAMAAKRISAKAREGPRGPRNRPRRCTWASSRRDDRHRGAIAFGALAPGADQVPEQPLRDVRVFLRIVRGRGGLGAEDVPTRLPNDPGQGRNLGLHDGGQGRTGLLGGEEAQAQPQQVEPLGRVVPLEPPFELAQEDRTRPLGQLRQRQAGHAQGGPRLGEGLRKQRLQGLIGPASHRIDGVRRQGRQGPHEHPAPRLEVIRTKSWALMRLATRGLDRKAALGVHAPPSPP